MRLECMCCIMCVDFNQSKSFGKFKCWWLSSNKTCNNDFSRLSIAINLRKKVGEVNYSNHNN
jgi:hypothetical protein